MVISLERNSQMYKQPATDSSVGEKKTHGHLLSIRHLIFSPPHFDKFNGDTTTAEEYNPKESILRWFNSNAGMMDHLYGSLLYSARPY